MTGSDVAASVAARHRRQVLYVFFSLGGKMGVAREIAGIAKELVPTFAIFAALVAGYLAALYNRRNDFEKWSREQRLAAYAEFLAAVQDLQNVRVDIHDFEAQADDVKKAAWEEEKELRNRVEQAAHKMFIASSKIELLSTAVVDTAVGNLILFALGEAARLGFDEYVSRLKVLRTEFLVHARKELGVK